MVNSNQNFNEDDLIARIHDGDKNAFGAVYTQYYDELLYFTAKLLNDKETASGIITETFIKLWDRRLNFPSVKNMRAFLHVTCRNQALNILRNIKTKRTVFTTEFPDQHSDPGAEAQIIEAEIMDQLYKELHHLSSHQKAIIELIIQGKSPKEICADLNISIQALRKTKSLAITRLRKEIKMRNLFFRLFFL